MPRYILLVIAFVIATRFEAYSEAAEPLRIGMPESMFPGVPKSWRTAVSDPFCKLLKEHTGLSGDLEYFADSRSLAEKQNCGKLDLGIIYGHEFAWEQTKYPDLKPLAIAVPNKPYQVFCLVRTECTAADIAELGNQKMSRPSIHHIYCDMFLEKLKRESMKKAYFSETSTAPTAVDAIFEVIQRKSACVVVDGATRDFFETAYPGAAKQLRILVQSEVFPNACVVVKDKALDPKTFSQLQDTLLQVDKLSGTKMLLSIWRIKGFKKPTEEYVRACEQFGKLYPLEARK